MGQWGWRGREQVSGLLPGWSAGASALSTFPGSLRALGTDGPCLMPVLSQWPRGGQLGTRTECLFLFV